MRTNLWIVIVVVSTIVGFLLGYSVSSYTGTRSVQPTAHAPEARPEAPKAASAAHPSQETAQEKPAAGGYGSPGGGAAAKPPAAGYGAPVVPATTAGSAGKPAPKAPGY